MAHTLYPRSPLALLAAVSVTGLLLAAGSAFAPFDSPDLREGAASSEPPPRERAAGPAAPRPAERLATGMEGWCCLRDTPPCVSGYNPRTCKVAEGTAFHAEAARCSRLCPLL